MTPGDKLEELIAGLRVFVDLPYDTPHDLKRLRKNLPIWLSHMQAAIDEIKRKEHAAQQ